MEFQALHDLAKKLLGVDVIRKEVLKVLSEDPQFQGLQEDISQQSSRSNTSLRRRLPASRKVGGDGDGSERLDDDPHADTWTEPSIPPGTPRSDPSMNQETLDLNSEWGGSDFELLPASSAASSDLASQDGQENDSTNPGIWQWLQKCAASMVKAVGQFCGGAVKMVKGALQNAAALMKDVSNWLQNSIAELKRRVAESPRWVKITGGVVALGVMMGFLLILMAPPPPLL